MSRLSLTALAWGFGLGLGAALAIVLGPTAPRWGMSLAFPVVALLLSLGALKEDDGDEMRHLLRFAIGFNLAFLLVTVPLTAVAIARVVSDAPPDLPVLRRVGEVRDVLFARWLVIALALPGAIGALWLRRRREAAVPARS